MSKSQLLWLWVHVLPVWHQAGSWIHIQRNWGTTVGKQSLRPAQLCPVNCSVPLREVGGMCCRLWRKCLLGCSPQVLHCKKWWKQKCPKNMHKLSCITHLTVTNVPAVKVISDSEKKFFFRSVKSTPYLRASCCHPNSNNCLMQKWCNKFMIKHSHACLWDIWGLRCFWRH